MVWLKLKLFLMRLADAHARGRRLPYGILPGIYAGCINRIESPGSFSGG